MNDDENLATRVKDNQNLRRSFQCWLPLSLLLALLPLTQLQAASLTSFGEYDKDHNGRLNRAEYAQTQYPAELFDAADSNQDAVLSTTEFEQLIQTLNEAQTRPGSGPHPPKG